jgi:hypothetical protein
MVLLIWLLLVSTINTQAATEVAVAVGTTTEVVTLEEVFTASTDERSDQKFFLGLNPLFLLLILGFV